MSSISPGCLGSSGPSPSSRGRELNGQFLRMRGVREGGDPLNIASSTVRYRKRSAKPGLSVHADSSCLMMSPSHLHADPAPAELPKSWHIKGETAHATAEGGCHPTRASNISCSICPSLRLEERACYASYTGSRAETRWALEADGASSLVSMCVAQKLAQTSRKRPRR